MVGNEERVRGERTTRRPAFLGHKPQPDHPHPRPARPPPHGQPAAPPAGSQRASPPSLSPSPPLPPFPPTFGICPKETWDDSLSARKSDCRVLGPARPARSRVHHPASPATLYAHRTRCIKTPHAFRTPLLFSFLQLFCSFSVLVPPRSLPPPRGPLPHFLSLISSSRLPHPARSYREYPPTRPTIIFGQT